MKPTKVRSMNFTTGAPHYHELTIVTDEGTHTFKPNVDQIMILMQQMLACVWSYYRQVPRD